MKVKNRIYTGLLAILLTLLTAELKASVADTVETYSAAMQKTIKAIVITPQSYKQTSDRLPVVYLLHGYGGSFRDWTRKVPQVNTYADLYNVIIVCADGGTGSWYLDSPEDSTYRYETYVARELVSWVDEHYQTDTRREARAIMGLSMGGHGALYMAFKHPETFGAAGSMSGGVDFRPFPANWELSRRLGTYTKYPKRWDENTVINMIDLIARNPPALIIDCGTDDFFYTVNVTFHRKLAMKKVPHDFIIRPGDHSWAYWKNAIGYQMLFMAKYFKRT